MPAIFLYVVVASLECHSVVLVHYLFSDLSAMCPAHYHFSDFDLNYFIFRVNFLFPIYISNVYTLFDAAAVSLILPNNKIGLIRQSGQSFPQLYLRFNKITFPTGHYFHIRENLVIRGSRIWSVCGMSTKLKLQVR